MGTTAWMGMKLTTNVLGQYAMYVEDCCNCGIPFAMPLAFRDHRVEDHQRFFCPNGHGQSYVGKTEEQKQRERAERAERERDWARIAQRAADDQAAATERSNRAYRGHLTRMRNRIANGVCPVQSCHRNFANVKAHILSQHPDWAHDHADALEVTK